jgi:hypothetical protein
MAQNVYQHYARGLGGGQAQEGGEARLPLLAHLPRRCRPCISRADVRLDRCLPLAAAQGVEGRVVGDAKQPALRPFDPAKRVNASAALVRASWTTSSPSSASRQCGRSSGAGAGAVPPSAGLASCAPFYERTKIMQRVTLVRYAAKPDRTAENETLARAVFAELRVAARIMWPSQDVSVRTPNEPARQTPAQTAAKS